VRSSELLLRQVTGILFHPSNQTVGRLFLASAVLLLAGALHAGQSLGVQAQEGAAPSQPQGTTAPPQGTTATISAFHARIIPPASGYRFPTDQTLVFGVEWHLFNAGTATVKMEHDTADLKVTAVADSAGVVNLLYPVHDHFEARVDPATFCSTRVFKHSEEGSHKRETRIQLDYAQHKSLLDEKNLKTSEIKHEENDIPGCVTDVITGFYYLASLPLQPGNVESFPVNDGGKTAEATARVEAKEQVKVPAGTFQTIRVSAEATSGKLRGKGKVWVWFTNDANHTPVQMRAKLGWGTLLYRLQRLEK